MCVWWGRSRDCYWVKSSWQEEQRTARSHLIWRDGYQEPLGFPRVSTLSSALSVLLELATGKGLWHPSSPSTSLSHCHQLFISPDTRPPQQGRLVLLSTPRPT